MLRQIVRGPLLVPHHGGSLDYHPAGALACDDHGRILFAGSWEQLRSLLGTGSPAGLRESDGVMLPPLLDIHTHIPQHPIRGRFVRVYRKTHRAAGC